MKNKTGKIPKTISVNLNLAKPIDKEIWEMIQRAQTRLNYKITESTAIKVLLADRKVAGIKSVETLRRLFPPYSNHNSLNTPLLAEKRRGRVSV